MRDLERSVCGCAYGSHSLDNAPGSGPHRRVARTRPAAKLLDVGAGTGWPGLFLAQLTGCDVVVVDLPLGGLRLALERAAAEACPSDAKSSQRTVLHCPSRTTSFDALSHSDVLCCTPDKLGVLRSCRRIARDGARMVVHGHRARTLIGRRRAADRDSVRPNVC